MIRNRQTKQKLLWAAVGVLACAFLPANVNPLALIAKFTSGNKQGA